MYNHNSKMKLIYEIVDEFGGDRKPELMRRLKELTNFQTQHIKTHVRKYLNTIE